MSRRAEAVYVLHAFPKRRKRLRDVISRSQETICATVERWKMRKPESYASVWDAIADTPGQAANLRARAELMRQIAALVKKERWTQVEAAQHCGVTQPRINDLLRGRGCRVRIDLEAA